MTADRSQMPVVAGPPLPLPGHATILPELAEWARGQLDGSPLDAERLAAVLAHSLHLRTLARAHPDLPAAILAGRGAEEVSAAIAACGQAADKVNDEAAMMAALRRLRARSALCVALCDMADMADVETQMAWLSDAAEAAIRSAVTFLFRQADRRGRFGEAEAEARAGRAGCGWMVLALGKLGARELNYSSDVDLILLHDPRENPLADPAQSQAFYVEAARALVRLLSTATGDGIGWRVDLRLRPDPGATAVSLQREAAIGYYESIARTWERAAFIRARPIAGDIALGRRFLADIQPFVWRRTLDYTVMEDMKMMLRRPAAAPGWEGFNLKTGPNGIRAVEFLTHVLQLVGGGRSHSLRQGSTLPALTALAGEGWIEPVQAAALGGLYLSLRRAEHRLQMIGDAQTHSLPRSREAMADMAAFLGHDGADGFLAVLSDCLDAIGRHAAHRLFQETPDDETDTPLLDDEDRLVAWLRSRGFARPGDIAAILAGWMAGRIAATRSERARTLLSRLMPPMLETVAGAQDPDAAFAAFAGFVEGLPASVQIFSLLDYNRDLTRLLGDILVLSPRLAHRLRRHPTLFDLVLLGEFFQPLAPVDELEGELRAALKDQPVELALDLVARITRERQFRAEVQRLSGVAGRRDLGTALADTAEAAIRVIRDLAMVDMARRHGDIDGDLAVIAMGRLGLRELTPTSDLDLVFVWDAPADAVSSGIGDGQRSLGAATYFNRLAQTLASWLGGATGEGRLFTIDSRLRPDGEKASLAPSLARLKTYYRDEAWLWEKLALGKARLLTPAATCGTATMEAISVAAGDMVAMEALASALHDMRRRFRASYGDAPEWRLRKQPGGIGELDLLIQGLRLANADLFPDPAMPAVGILDALVAGGRLSPEDAAELAAAGELYDDLQHALRLVVGTSALAPDALSAAAMRFVLESCDSPDTDTLRARIAAQRDRTDILFNRLIPPPSP